MNIQARMTKACLAVSAPPQVSSFVLRHSSFLLLLFPLTLHGADNLGILGSKPKWEVLEHYQETITHDEFTHLINDVYCTHGFAADLIKIDNDAAQILANRESHNVFTLRFAPDANSEAHTPRLWRPAKSLPSAKPGKPLLGLRVAIDPEKEQTIRWQSEMLFYRYSEIRRRAVLVNTKLHPDLVLCLHFNAEGWGDPSKPTLIDNNHLHLLVNGSYLQEELDLDDERFEMIRRLLSRAYDEELPIADTVTTSMAKATGLPPYQYPTTLTTTKVGSSGYVYARNLLATRLYRCPVVYCEPYVMNSKDGFARIQAGDYDRTKQINGVDRKSIFREYADSVAEGLAEYYRNTRGL